MHDSRGKPLKVGDPVILRATVKEITSEEGFCNLEIETAEPMFPGNDPSRFWVNAKQVDLVEPPPLNVAVTSMGYDQLLADIERLVRDTLAKAIEVWEAKRQMPSPMGDGKGKLTYDGEPATAAVSDFPLDPETGNYRWVNVQMLRNWPAQIRAMFAPANFDLRDLDPDQRFYAPRYAFPE